MIAVGLILSVAAGPSTSVDVQWNKGSGPKQMAKGIPNPPGWYEAAVGSRTSEKVLYLTFDDGPSPHTASLLKALKKYDARATFFVIGPYAQANPAMIKRMHRQGHAIGNHTWNHPRMTQIPTSQVRSELRRTKAVTGSAMGPCMRPPYGMVNSRVAKASIAEGFQPVLWTQHIEDWAPHSLAWTVDRLQADTRPGAVILMHDTHAQTVAAVKQMLPRWVKQGYSFAAVPACQ